MIISIEMVVIFRERVVRHLDVVSDADWMRTRPDCRRGNSAFLVIRKVGDGVA